MKKLLATTTLFLGVYFSSLSGQLIFLRGGGRSTFFQVLEKIMWYIPYIGGIVIAILGGILIFKTNFGESRRGLKIIGTLLLAALPTVVHFLMLSATYHAGPLPQQTQIGSLSMGEWSIFIVGILLLIGSGVAFFRSGPVVTGSGF